MLWPSRHRISARFVVDKLRKKGIRQDDIRGDQLDFVYSQTFPIFNSPEGDLSGITISTSNVSAAGSSEPLWGVIVEPRPHPLLAYVVKNVHETLGIPVQIIHGKGSRDFIRASALGSLIDKGDVVLTELNVDSLYPVPFLNEFLLSDLYWNALEGRKRILSFQSDAIICPKSDYQVSDFFSFDYIGTRWDWHRPNNLEIHGGCGGLCLFDWQAAVTCRSRFPHHLWEGASDEYFSFHIPIMGGTVGNELSCLKWATEEFFFTKSFGAHKISLLSPKALEAFLEYCPEAKPLLGGRNR